MELDQFDYGTAAVEVWESATKFYKNKHYAWTEYANYLTCVPYIYKNSQVGILTIGLGNAVKDIR